MVNTLREEERFEATVQHFIGWLRGIGLVVGTPSYVDDGDTDKIAVIVDLDGKPLDIEPNIKVVIKMGIEHFKVIAGQLGKDAWR